MRATFATRLGTILAMIGVAVGLGNVWRFPYMVGSYGGSAFVLFYVILALLIGVPGLMAEWSLGRATRKGTVGAFEVAGMPGGRWIGWFFFFTVTMATAYYVNAIGWVVYHAFAAAVNGAGLADLDASRILPPDSGFDGTSFGLQLFATASVLGASAGVLIRGVRDGIERASRVITPVLFVLLIILVVRSVTLPGASEGIEWFALKFDPATLSPTVALAALGQVVFSLALGGTFMVVYGSYLPEDEPLEGSAMWTVGGDVSAGLLAGLVIFPAVFAVGAEPGSGPGLLFSTLPQVFAQIPGGPAWGGLFFLALGGAAFLSGVAALEVLIAALTDNTSLRRTVATACICGLVLLASMPPMINMEVFTPWDLLFGSGMQTLGALVAAIAAGWFLSRSTLVASLGGGRRGTWLAAWVRWILPGSIILVGLWWTFDTVLSRSG